MTNLKVFIVPPVYHISNKMKFFGKFSTIDLLKGLMFMSTLIETRNADGDVLLIRSTMKEDFGKNFSYIRNQYSFPHNWSNPIIVNLDKLLTQFSSRGCLISIHNMLHSDIQDGLMSPVILQTPVPLAIHWSSAFSPLIKPVLGPIQLASHNFTEFPGGSFPCPLSKFLIGGSRRYALKDLCTRINFRLFWNHTRNWNCFTQVTMFPNMYHYEAFHLIEDDYHQRREGISHFVFHNVDVPPLRIFLTDKSSASEMFKHLRALTAHHTPNCDSVFLFANVNASLSEKHEPPSAAITQIELLKMCPTGLNSTNLILPDWDSLPSSWNLLKATQLQSARNLGWSLGYFEGDQRGTILNRVLQFLHNGSESRLVYQNLVDLPDFVAHAQAQVWLSIMNNHSQIAKGSCTTDNCLMMLRIKMFIKGIHLFPYSTSDESTNIAFVSCGERAITPYPFRELINVFDIWIWILILTSIIAVTLPLVAFSEMGLHPEILWLSPIKVLLEQGDPFPTRVVEEKRLSYVVISFLLAGIVLSNAYKNNNVYNMITPRRQVPYEHFSELIQDQFEIFTRVVAVGITATDDPAGFVGNLNLTRASYYHKYYPGVIAITAISEVAQIMRKMVNVVEMLNHFYTYVDYDLLVNRSKLNFYGVLTASRVQPNLRKLLTPAIFTDTSSQGTISKAEKQETEILMAQEEIDLFDRLKNCNKVALVLPAYICTRHAKNLKFLLGHEAPVFLGKDEPYSELEWMIRVEGIIPPHLPARIKSVHEAGIFRRWSEWLTKSGISDIQDSTINGVAAAKINGNIVVIFILLLGGLCISIVCILLECLYYISISNRLKHKRR